MRKLAILLLPLSLLLLGLGRAARWLRRATLKQGTWTELELEGKVSTLAPKERLAQMVAEALGRPPEPKVVLPELRRQVDGILETPAVRGVMVKIGPLEGGWPEAVALRAELTRLREGGRRVVAFLDLAADNAAYLVASAAEHIVAPPVVPIAPVGVASGAVFMKQALDKLGVEIETTGHGRYKSAPERFTREARSDFDREQTQALVDALDGTLIDAVAKGRSLSPADAEAAMRAAPLVGEAAVQRRLLDGLARYEALPELAAKLEQREAPPPFVPVAQLVARPPGPIDRLRKRVGVVQVEGAIVDRAFGPMGDGMAVEKAVVADLRQALADPKVGAVVLYVDSRGGSVTASDAIAQAVRRVDRDKPVIACFGDVAASGGYYVACGARAIVASPLSITGSIGVFSTLPTWPELAARLGLHHDVIQNRDNAVLHDPWRRRSEDERARDQALVDALYGQFVDLVASARGVDRAAVEAVAEGRVWTGRDAAERGLLDGLGGLEEAIDRAKAAAGGRFAAGPVRVKAKRPLPRPAAKPAKPAEAAWLLDALPLPPLLREALLLTQGSPRGTRVWAWSPLELP